MTDLFRAGYRDIRTYGGDSKGFAIDLSDNTNQWGVPPAAEAAMRDAAQAMLRGYPQPYGETLKDALAAYVGLSDDHIVTGTGSDDVLDCTFRALGEPANRVAYQSPTFVMVPTFAQTNGLMPMPVPLTSTYDIDVDAMLATGAEILYLCTPNNPTGGALSRAAIETVVERAPGFVVLDEAYVDFADDSYVDLVRRFPRVVIARTFSKAFGLAGLRIGYGIASPEIIHEIEKARGPYKLTSIGERVARAALVDDLAWVKAHVAKAIEEREWLRDQLQQRGIEPLESQANFVFAPIDNAMRLAAMMADRGVAVRPFANMPRIDARLAATNGQAMRITAAPRPMLQTMLDALDEARAMVTRETCS